MRKVFISTIILNPISQITYESMDMDLGGKRFLLPISYLLDGNLDEGDDVLIITGIQQSDRPKANYELLEKELMGILEKHKAHATFVKIAEPDVNSSEREKNDSLTFSEFFRDIADNIQDGDKIYADMSYGLKCYTLAMFISLCYAVKACRDVEISNMIYADLYHGQEKDTKEKVVDIVDITALFHINTIISDARPGQKKDMDRFLKFLIG